MTPVPGDIQLTATLPASCWNLILDLLDHRVLHHDASPIIQAIVGQLRAQTSQLPPPPDDPQLELPIPRLNGHAAPQGVV